MRIHRLLNTVVLTTNNPVYHEKREDIRELNRLKRRWLVRWAGSMQTEEGVVLRRYRATKLGMSSERDLYAGIGQALRKTGVMYVVTRQSDPTT